MSTYSLNATHSLRRDRIRGRGNGTIRIRCLLTVHSPYLQPATAQLLGSGIGEKRMRGFSITHVSSSHGNFGVRSWTFELEMRVNKSDVRTRRWWGRQLPTGDLTELPLELLGLLEAALIRTWQRNADYCDPKAKAIGTLKLVA